MSYDLCVIGSINCDLLISQDRLPLKGETYLGNNLVVRGGGKGSNQAYQSTKLGIRTVLLGAVGSDIFGAKALENYSEYPETVRYIKKTEIDTGLGIVNYLGDGSVYATIIKGANEEVTIDYIDSMINVIKHSSIILLQMEIPIETIKHSIKIAHDLNKIIILNAAPPVDISNEYLKMVDYLILNETETEYYSGKNITTVNDAITVGSALSYQLDNTIIITLGENGSVVVNKDYNDYIPALKVDNVVDTTGAGDSFIGTFVYGILNKHDTKKSCEIATVASSLTITNVGAQESMPDLNAIIE